MTKPHDWWNEAQARLRAWRRRLKAHMPYVRRREYKKLEAKYARVTQCLVEDMRYASKAELVGTKPVEGTLAGEVCLFVSYASQPRLKAHVRWHIKHLLDAEIQVVLVVNTDVEASQFELDPDLVGRLSGCYVRGNLGFDFAAWAHVHSHLGAQLCCDRLYLLNDSIVGPVDRASFDSMIARIRRSPSDVIGLTENIYPSVHLQSFFLAFSRRALQSKTLRSILDNMLALPTKEMVIDVYETQLSGRLRQSGLTVEALFPTLAKSLYDSNDTWFRWEELLRVGFPYIKASVVDRYSDSPRITDALPKELAASYRKAAP